MSKSSTELAVYVVKKSAPAITKLGMSEEGLLAIESKVGLCLAENSYLTEVVQDPRAAVTMAIAVARAISLGLDQFGGPLATAYLVPFKNKDKKTGRFYSVVQLIPSYRGLAGLAIRDGLVSDISSGILFTSDEASLEFFDGADRTLKYRPCFKSNREILNAAGNTAEELNKKNPPLFVWCAWTTPEGRRDFHWMTIDAIIKTRNGSKSWNPNKLWASTWGSWPMEMFKKTVIKRAAKMWGLGVSSKSEHLVEALERATVEDTGEGLHADTEIIDGVFESEGDTEGDKLAREISQ